MTFLRIGICALVVFGIAAHGAVEDWARAGLKHGTGPVLDSTMSSDAKNNEGADSDTQERHGRGFPAAIGISVTSSTQALPLIRLSSFPLRLRTTQTRA